MEKVKIKNVLLVITYVISLTGFLSISQYISIFYSGLFSLLFILGIYSDFKQIHPVPRILLNFIALLFVIYKFITTPIEDPAVSILEALVFLLGIKLLEEKSFRDFLQIYIISIFLLAGYALVSIDMIFIVYFVLLLFLITTAVVMLAFYFENPELIVNKHILSKIFTVGFFIPVISIPLAVILFIILPRTDYPLFSFLNHGIKASTGFSESVKLGEVSDIQEDNSIIMRVKMEQINNRFLYWRGIVLSFFDGKEWRNIETYEKDGIVKGTKVKQEIILEPYYNKYLFALDKPVLINKKNIRGNDDFTFYLPNEIKKRTKYQAISVLTDSIKAENIEKDIYLQLPKDIKDNLLNLATSLKKDTPIKTVYSILNFLKQNYQYSLTELPKSNNPVIDFLLKTKKGNCEYFASAAAVLLRLNNIPTRLIAGYKGGYYNDIGKYYIIPQKNAHVWIEVYINKHWIRLDPTPASIELFTENEKKLKDRLKYIFDTFEFFWINFVINFDFQKQINLFKSLKSNLEKPKLKTSINKEIIILTFLSLLLIILIFILIYRIYKYVTTPVEKKILDSFYKKLSKAGYKKKEYETLIDFVNKIEDKNKRNLALQFAVKFESKFYKDEPFTKEDIKTLKDIISKI